MSEQSNPIRILHVDDEPAFADLVATYLERENERFEIESAASASAGIDLLEGAEFDCIVSDYDMPRQNGIEFLECVRGDYPNLPFILFTGKGSEEVASDAITAGATDYLQKGGGTDRYELLANRVLNAVNQYRATQEAQSMQRRLQELAESSTDCLWIFDRDWEELLFISGYEAVWDRPAEAIKQNPQDFLEGVDPDHRDRVKEAMKRLSTGKSIDIEYKIRRGTDEPGWVWVKGEPVFDDDGNVVRVVGFTREVTERKEHERELKRNERRYQAIFNDPNILGGLLDTDGTVLDINQTAMEYVNASPGTVTGTPLWETPWFNHSGSVQDEVRDWIERAAQGQYVEFEASLMRPNGDPYTVKGVFRPVRDDDGEVVSLLITDRDITEQKEREHELETMSRRLGAILDNTTSPMFMKDDEGRYIFVNQGYRDLFGLEDADIVGRTDSELHPPAVAEQVKQNDERVLKRGDPIEVEERIVAGGTERVFLSTKVPIYDTGDRSGSDEPVAVFGVASDITERKEAKQRLEEEQHFVESIFDALPDPLYAFNTDGYPIRWNDRLEEVTGYTSDEIAAMHVTDLVSADDAERIDTEVQTILEKRTSVTTESAIETKSGRQIPYELTGGPLEDAAGTLRGITGVGRDLTARKEREQRLKALSEVANELMTAESREEVVERGVEAGREVLGLEASAIHLYEESSGLVPVAQTATGHDLIGEPPTFTGGDSIAWRVYEQGEPLALDDVHDDPDIYNPESILQSELYLPLGDHGVMIAASDTTETFDQQDIVLGEILAGSIVGALKHVERTERLRAREQELTRQNDRLEEFASIVSHDLRNPLSVAEGRLELAREECDSAHLEDVDHALNRMNLLIDNLLTLAREGSQLGDVNPVELGRLTENCWQNVSTADANLNTTIERPIQADGSRLQQLLENLLRNSVEHGGEDVTVTIGALEDGFYLEDDGPSIPVDKRDDVFKAGYSTREDGTGFGLSIVKQIVDAHGWQIRVTDGSDGGARVEITGIEPTK